MAKKKKQINIFININQPKTTEQLVDEALKNMFPSLYRK
jgi:hypothetical protein